MKSRVIWCNNGWMPIRYGFCPDEKAWRREMKKMGRDMAYPVSEGGATTFRDDGKVTVIVTIADGAEARIGHLGILGLLVHEGTHVWQDIKRKIGETEPGDEMEAYAVQAICQELMWAWDKTRGRKDG